MFLYTLRSQFNINLLLSKAASILMKVIRFVIKSLLIEAVFGICKLGYLPNLHNLPLAQECPPTILFSCTIFPKNLMYFSVIESHLEHPRPLKQTVFQREMRWRRKKWAGHQRARKFNVETWDVFECRTLITHNSVRLLISTL